jgi:hypothetical protein
MQIPKVSTTTNLVGMIGSIKSPNFPAAYPDSSDYRWKIVTEPGTSIRLLFALFETQEKCCTACTAPREIWIIVDTFRCQLFLKRNARQIYIG